MKSRFAILSIYALALAACGSDETTVRGEDGGEMTYTADGDTFDAEITTDEGETISVNSAPDAPVDLPEGFSLIPGARVTANTVMQQGGGKATVLTFESDRPVGEVISYYRKQAEEAGFEIAAEARTGDTQMLMGEGPDGGSGSGLHLSASPSGEGTEATLMVGAGMGG